MASPTSILSFLLLLLLLLLLADLTATVGSSTEVIKMYPRQHVVAEEPKCESWKFSIDVNNAGSWNSIPRPCIDFVKDYFNSGRYTADSRSAAAFSLTFARSVEVTEGDAWIFDVDETLLSNLQFYKDNEFGLKPYNDTSFIEWVKKGSAPALPASFAVYKWVKKLGFKIFILTGRDESLRAVTEQNLIAAGYSGWEELILRGPNDKGKKNMEYKSEKRGELVKKGYTIQGSSGDQWSDLMGFALAKRSFKHPNPMYYVS
ncbi:acid phosphatase 1-like [Cucumis melo var. makuwa]|uniref:Acid phosphatase 1-like n=1 Tax=Cucumis melo var. makuwa TaxID=1194695 RepID=A0A5A7V1U1_CUCMM|nr:acid phosphatase 1-like [Cucumis melo var. makuwa]TYK10755.1 acid phosphatase 1-like [Cucumis melo var. makuwa]